MKTKPLHGIFIQLLLTVTIFEATKANVLQTGLQKQRVEILNPKYKVEWQANFDLKTIEINVTAEATGYVGFGLSLGGKMTGADIVIGGVFPNGTNYFNDYHGVRNGMPVLDDEQNWELLSASENGGFTYLTFTRALDTCDEDDVQITAGTVKLIWALGETDTLAHHGANRGALAVNMLDPPIPPTDLTEFNESDFTVDITLTGEDTVYYCSVHKRRSIPTMTHIVAFKPKLETPDALKYTHHFNIYFCKAPEGHTAEEFYEPHIDKPVQYCHNRSFLEIRSNCYVNLYAWSFGGRLLVLPDDIGFPWGFEEHEYFMFEVHINNPEKIVGNAFQTGVQFYDTTEHRPEEAGMLAIGHSTSPSLLIPPATTDWMITGHCSSSCTAKTIPDTGINLFNVNLHAHISGRKIKLRHFRDGKELRWIAKDETYDFDFQENRPLSEDLKVLPGDHISLECSYDSTWKSIPSAVIGGPSSTDEMCNTFIFYYPRISLESCFSLYPNEKMYERYGIESVSTTPGAYGDPIITAPEKLANRTYSDVVSNDVQWTDEMRTELQKELRFGEHSDICFTNDDTVVAKNFVGKVASDEYPWPKSVGYPEFEEEYEELRDCVENIETTTSPSTVEISTVPEIETTIPSVTEFEATTSASTSKVLLPVVLGFVLNCILIGLF